MSRRSLPKTGTVRYLHVSVQVKAPDQDLGKPAMRTPPGKGSTAGRKPQPGDNEPSGRQRRRAQRLERLEREKLAAGVDAPR